MRAPTIVLLLTLTTFFTGCAEPGASDDGEPSDDVAGTSTDALTSSCSGWSTKKLSLPNKRDLVTRVQACVELHENGQVVRGRVNVTWEPVQSLGLMTGKKVEAFVVESFMRSDGKYAPYDDQGYCDITDRVNANWSGSATCTNTWHARLGHRWDTVGSVSLKVAGDNSAKIYDWNLIASPAVR